MAKASNYLEDMILNYFLRNQQVTQPTNLYLALYKTNPTDADTGAEVVGGGYARQQISFTAPTQQSDKAVIGNATRIEFPTANAEWGEVAYFGIRDAREGGNLLVHGAFNKPTQIVEGNKFILDSGNLTVTMA
ncbi:phage tail fiber protein [Peptoniphilus vaginalis]|uniref:phage tail fiber protein n=1 Tax=Peptoniphilus vaginalis TaxID=1756987 RepID=UPI0023F7C9A0|nr:hypothetical protein [Peptoniphilus vaginalis]